MWGNSLGWSISAVLAAIILAGAVWLHHASNLTGTTDFVRDPRNLAPIELPVEPRTLLAPRDPSRDAGEIYLAAIEAYLERPDDYERFLLGGQSVEDLPPDAAAGALQRLLEAGGCSTMTLFILEPQSVVKYGAKPRLEALANLGRVANKLGLLLARDGRKDEAMTYHAAAFALGAGLYEERLVLDELLAGLELMGAAAAAIEGIDPASPFAAYRGLAIPYQRERVEPVQRVVTSIDQAVLEEHAGDVFYIARESRERMWRVEAILKLGRYRYNAGRASDQRAAARAIRRLRDTDPDPVIRAAAQSALDLTIEQYRILGG